MTATVTCSECDTPLPEGASFCPHCGHATPTELSKATGEAPRLNPADADEAPFRARLQRAIGSTYELREVIGRGGFGVVYTAWDVELQREVAVKALRHDFYPVASILERFKREARAVAKLRHPNVIPIYAVGEGEGIAYMIMPKIVGESLKSLLAREGALPIEEARRILTEAARALGVAHRAGIIHRDVKPQNILLEGEERRVYLTDFGIAKAVEADGEGLTGTGMVVGTPAFMSPEQASGVPNIDHRSDLYSLGVLGFHLLSSQLPFEASSLHDLIFQQVTREAPDVRSLRSEIPQDLAATIARCLRRNPAERWDSAEELVSALQGEQPRVAKRKRGPAFLLIGFAAVTSMGVAAYLVFAKPGWGGAGSPSSTVSSQSPTAPADSAADSAVPTTPAITVQEGGADSAGPSAPTREAQPVPPPVQSRPSPLPGEQPPAQPTVGYLTIAASPWGMLRIDGVNIGATPITRYELPPGSHVLSVVKDGYETWEDTVMIEAGNEVRRRPRLVRRQ